MEPPWRKSEFGTAKAEQRVNLLKRFIQLGQLRVHFLITGYNSSGRIAVLRLIVTGGSRLMAPPIATSDEDPGGSMRLRVQHGSSPKTAKTRISSDLKRFYSLAIPRSFIHCPTSIDVPRG